MRLLILLIIVAVVVWLLRRILGTRAGAEVVQNTKVLVSGLDEHAQGLADADAEVYSSFYRHVDVLRPGFVNELLAAVREQGYDVVHLLCEVDEDGNLLGAGGSKLGGTDFLEACRQGNVKLLFMARDNPSDNYVRAFVGDKRPRDLAINLVLTLDRKGDAFPAFLRGLLRRMSTGVTMPMAWVELAPQIPNAPPRDDLPDAICTMDRGGTQLLP